MTLTDMITPDIEHLLPTDAVVQARGRALAAELGSTPTTRRRSSPGTAGGSAGAGRARPSRRQRRAGRPSPTPTGSNSSSSSRRGRRPR